MINYRLKIDFSDSKTLASDICFVSGDVKSSTLYFEFYNEEKRVDISGYTLSIRAKRSDGVVVASTGKIKENTAVFTPESNMYCVPGELYMEIALTDATGKYATTKIITAEVVEGLGETAIEGVDNLNVYVKLISDAISAKEEAKAAAEVAKSVHPKIIDEEWWVYDYETNGLISTGIKAEGPQGEKGDKGEKGNAGADGYSPVKGVDYYTEEEKTEILNEVLQETSPRYANALKDNASGEIVSITDISPVEHNLGVKVSSKNLANLNQVPWRINRANIVEQTYDTLKLETTVNGVKWTGVYYELPESLIGKTLTLSSTWEMSNPNSQGALRIQWIDGSGAYLGGMLGYLNVSGQVRTFTISEKPEGATKLVLIVYAVADSTNAVAGDTITYKNIQLEKGTTATNYTPYVPDANKATLTAVGKNILNKGDFTVFDSAKIYIDFEIYMPGTYYFSSNIHKITGLSFALGVIAQDESNFNSAIKLISSYAQAIDKAAFDITEAGIYRFLLATNNSSDMSVIKNHIESDAWFQIEYGSTASPPQEYVEPQIITSDADGVVRGVTSVYPSTTLLTDTQGVLIECEYNKDINKAFAELQNAIISLGGNV